MPNIIQHHTVGRILLNDSYEPFRARVQAIHDQHKSIFPREVIDLATRMQETYKSVYNWGSTFFKDTTRNQTEYREEIVIPHPK